MESGDDQIYVSYGLVLHGSYGDLKKLRQLIFDFLGVEVESKHIHQRKLRTSLELKYQTVSSSPLWIEKKNKIERMEEEIEELRREVEELKRREKTGE